MPLVIEARDPDFALSYIDLNIEKDGSPVNGPTIYSERNDQQFKTTYKWSLRDYHFRPRETVTYWLEAKDNRQPIANVSRTPKLRIRIVDPVSEEQVKKDLAMNQQRQKEEIDKSEAEHAAQDKPDNDSSSPNANKKQQKAGRPQEQLASRDQRQNPSQNGEGGNGPTVRTVKSKTASNRTPSKMGRKKEREGKRTRTPPVMMTRSRN